MYWCLCTASIQLNCVASDTIHCLSTLVCIHSFVHSSSSYQGLLLALSSIVFQLAMLVTSYVPSRVPFIQPLLLTFISSKYWIILSFRMIAPSTPSRAHTLLERLFSVRLVAGFSRVFSDNKYTTHQFCHCIQILWLFSVNPLFHPFIHSLNHLFYSLFLPYLFFSLACVNHRLVSLIACITYYSDVILLLTLSFFRLCLLPSSVTLNQFFSTFLTSVYVSL